jgi:hypothetical protein
MKPPLIATAFAILVAQVSLHALPVITSGPTPQAMFVRIGSNVTFSITATGNITPLKLQWRLNGTNIPGATNSTLAITNAQDKDHGTYTVLAIDASGAVGSPRAILVVDTNEVAETGGTLNLANVGVGVNAPVTNGAVYPFVRAGGDCVVQLWVGPAGATSSALQPTGPLVVLQDGAGAGYFTSGLRFVPIAKPGDIITVQLRAFPWRPRPARHFDDADNAGESNPIQVQLGAANGPNLFGLQGWTIGYLSYYNCPLEPSNVVARFGQMMEFTRPSCPGGQPTIFDWEKDGGIVAGTRTNLVVEKIQLSDVGEYRFHARRLGESAPLRLTLLFNPYFESAAIAGGNFHALIGGSISNSLTIQSSADLINWMPELTVSELNGFLPFDRDMSTNGPRRFFRLLSQ